MSEEAATQNNEQLAAAEARARAVEEENRKLKSEDRARKKAEEQKKIEASAVDLASAKTKLDELNTMAAKLEAENESLRKREQDRIATAVKGLPEAARKRLKAIEGEVSLAKYSELVELESSTMEPAATPQDKDSKTPPPPVALGGVRRRGDTTENGRQLQPQTYDLLDEWGESPELARKLMTVEQAGNGHRFVVPPGQLRRMLQKQAPRPIVLNEENAPRR